MIHHHGEPEATPPLDQGTSRMRCPHCEAEYDSTVSFCPHDGAALRAVSLRPELTGTVMAGRFRVLHKLGAGGMGTVYLAEQIRLGRRCALKVLSPMREQDGDAVAHFEREAANASRINHPNVAAVYDFGEAADGRLFLAMEYIDGEPLTSLAEREGPLPPHRVADIVRQVANGLEAAHALGIVHRDLKPDNIMVGRNRDGSDCVKVVDFGIAKAMQSGSQMLTATGLLVGTPRYMSPEQLSGDRVDSRSDIYSLGLITYALLTGVLPFPSNPEALLARLVSPPMPLAQARPDVAWPATLEAVLRRALSVSQIERPASAEEFCKELSRAIAEWQPAAKAAVPRPAALRRKAPMLVGAVAVATIVIVVAASASGLGRERRPMPLAGAAGAANADAGAKDPTAASESPIAEGMERDATLPPPERGRVTETAAGDVSREPLEGAVPKSPVERPPASAPVPSAPAASRELPATPVADELKRLRDWTDPSGGDAASARRALRLVPSLLPRLTTEADSVEALFHAAGAHLLLEDDVAACDVLIGIEQRSRRHPYLANAVAGYLGSSALGCR